MVLFGVEVPILITIATSVVGTFALIAAVTPNKTDDKVTQFLSNIVNFLGANFGKAKNDPKEK